MSPRSGAVSGLRGYEPSTNDAFCWRGNGAGCGVEEGIFTLYILHTSFAWWHYRDILSFQVCVFSSMQIQRYQKQKRKKKNTDNGHGKSCKFSQRKTGNLQMHEFNDYHPVRFGYLGFPPYKFPRETLGYHEYMELMEALAFSIFHFKTLLFGALYIKWLLMYRHKSDSTHQNGKMSMFILSFL